LCDSPLVQLRTEPTEPWPPCCVVCGMGRGVPFQLPSAIPGRRGSEISPITLLGGGGVCCVVEREQENRLVRLLRAGRWKERWTFNPCTHPELADRNNVERIIILSRFEGRSMVQRSMECQCFHPFYHAGPGPTFFSPVSPVCVFHSLARMRTWFIFFFPRRSLSSIFEACHSIARPVPELHLVSFLMSR
jgi:hypothetical protein